MESWAMQNVVSPEKKYNMLAFLCFPVKKIIESVFTLS